MQDTLPLAWGSAPTPGSGPGPGWECLTGHEIPIIEVVDLNFLALHLQHLGRVVHPAVLTAPRSLDSTD